MVSIFQETQTPSGLELVACATNNRKESETLRIMRNGTPLTLMVTP